MKTGSTKPEWDTPPHGDFASYVERLTAPKPSSSPALTAARASTVVKVSKTHVLPADLGQVLVPWMGGVRVARAVLLVLMGLQGIALIFWGRGSLVGLIATGTLWWVLGRLLDAAPGILRVLGTAVRTDTQSFEDRPRPLSPQRNTGKKK